MKKLFLASFLFTTGEKEYKEYRLILVTKADLQEYIRKMDKAPAEKAADFFENQRQAELEIAYEKAEAWFPTAFPQSVWMSTVIHPAIV